MCNKVPYLHGLNIITTLEAHVWDISIVSDVHWNHNTAIVTRDSKTNGSTVASCPLREHARVPPKFPLPIFGTADFLYLNHTVHLWLIPCAISATTCLMNKSTDSHSSIAVNADLLYVAAPPGERHPKCRAKRTVAQSHAQGYIDWARSKCDMAWHNAFPSFCKPCVRASSFVLRVISWFLVL